MSWTRMSLDTAAELVDMGDHPRRDSQLKGAVAMHNILQRERVAYLADEVGLGKTYVSLATLALFRHYEPGFRVLVIAPKRNIQAKWVRDWRTFVHNNWKIADLRVKGASGSPVRRTGQPERLVDLVHDAVGNERLDLFTRLPSYSFATTGSRDAIRDRLRTIVPWLDGRTLPRDPGSAAMRDYVAQAYNAALRPYDLVIIDEAHNLKAGIRVQDDGKVVASASNRNAVLAQVLGHPDVTPAPAFAEHYRPLAERVLMLSATPVEASFTAMWNQVHLVGKHLPPGQPSLDGLRDPDTAQGTAERILVRRVNSMRVNGTELTKNTYRRTWFEGGVAEHDQPLDPGDVRQRLTVALVQKRVSDVVGTKFGNAFQLGMLASFESFAETSASRSAGPSAPSASSTPSAPIASLADEDIAAEATFDGGEQTTDDSERQGVDTAVVNALARDHVEEFGEELAHPKMDGLVRDLARSWETGRKALVFVRRIASVDEIKRKLDETYDAWLLARLERELPAPVWAALETTREAYRRERIARGRHEVGVQGVGERDSGGADTFFAWFFRGDGPDLSAVGGLESGASIARKTGATGGPASTFFAINYLSEVLACAPDRILPTMADRLGTTVDDVTDQLEAGAQRYLPASAGRRDQHDAVQYAGLAILEEADDVAAEMLLRELNVSDRGSRRHQTLFVPRQLTMTTFFSRLHRFPELRRDLLGEGHDTTTHAVRDRVLRSIAIATAARRGHPGIDLYVALAEVVGVGPVDSNKQADGVVDGFVSTLERQRLERDLSGGYRELAAIGRDFELLRSLNLPRTTEETFELSSAGADCGTLFGAQQPTVGLARRVNETAVRQFRMPGYPYVLVCTDVLQEGEDLHTSCDRVIHYGVAWTSSAMEQRCGRVDRIRSLAERRFGELDVAGRDPAGDQLIQVQLPYLRDTVEVLQARRVIERMHRFTTLMHQIEPDDKRLDIDAEIHRTGWQPPRIDEALKTAFPVLKDDLRGRSRHPLVASSDVERWWTRLIALTTDEATRDLFQRSRGDRDRLALYGERHLGDRVQPFTVRLDSHDTFLLAWVQTPLATWSTLGDLGALQRGLTGLDGRIVVVDDVAKRQREVALADDVLLMRSVDDAARVGGLVRRLTEEADRAEREIAELPSSGGEQG